MNFLFIMFFIGSLRGFNILIIGGWISLFKFSFLGFVYKFFGKFVRNIIFFFYKVFIDL